MSYSAEQNVNYTENKIHTKHFGIAMNCWPLLVARVVLFCRPSTRQVREAASVVVLSSLWNQTLK